MYVVLIIVVAALLLIGIIFLKSGSGSFKAKPRMEFLQELTKKLEGRIEEMRESPEGYRIRFRLENREFVFEDIYTVGFTTDKLNKAFVKLQLNATLSVTFTERKAKSTMRSDIIIASKIPKGKINPTEVDVPSGLREFIVHTNNIPQANSLFADSKVARIFAEFKNKDGRGYPLMALKIMDGELILEYQMVNHFNPSLNDLHGNPEVIEDHAAMLLVVAKKVEQLAL